MTESIKRNRIGTVFDALEYPLSPQHVAGECGDVTVRLAEGSVSVGNMLERSGADRFTSRDGLELEFLSLLPGSAVGEPFQSGGDA
ncbi:MAG: hypothetical protein ABEI27_02560 [Halobellus sp.]|uniref:DUF5789 family protein n=1 Tax=Halobellus sp. TaxID=1979212 RepID=UPI0035D45740